MKAKGLALYLQMELSPLPFGLQAKYFTPFHPRHFQGVIVWDEASRHYIYFFDLYPLRTTLVKIIIPGVVQFE